MAKPVVVVTGIAGNLGSRLLPMLQRFSVIGVDITPPQTQTVELAGAARPVAVNPAAHLLFGTSDAAPVFLILTIGALMGLAIAGFLSRLRTARG